MARLPKSRSIKKKREFICFLLLLLLLFFSFRYPIIAVIFISYINLFLFNAKFIFLFELEIYDCEIKTDQEEAVFSFNALKWSSRMMGRLVKINLQLSSLVAWPVVSGQFFWFLTIRVRLVSSPRRDDCQRWSIFYFNWPDIVRGPEWPFRECSRVVYPSPAIET